MDVAFILGLVLAFGSLFAMISMEGASVTALLLPAPMILVFGGTIAVAVASSTLRDSIHAIRSVPKAFTGKQKRAATVIPQIIEYAEIARTQGLLALEEKIGETKDPFIRKALQAIADGVDGDELRLLLEEEVAQTAARNRTASKFFMTMGGYAPTVGIIGTVVSLTHVLENLSEPAELGHMIAAAFVATLWGLLSANFMWLPIGNRLGRLAEVEDDRMNLILEGMVSIQSGDPVHLVTERLTAMAGETPKQKKGQDAPQDVTDNTPTTPQPVSARGTR